MAARRPGKQFPERTTNGTIAPAALARGLAVMASFGADRRSQSLSEVAQALGLPRAMARRALLTPVALGYLETEGRQFRLTPRVLRLAAAYLTSDTVSALLQPACDRVARTVGEACTVAVPEQDEVVMIARARPRAAGRPAGACARRQPRAHRAPSRHPAYVIAALLLAGAAALSACLI